MPVDFYINWHVLFSVVFPPDLIAAVSGYSQDLKTARFVCFNLL